MKKPAIYAAILFAVAVAAWRYAPHLPDFEGFSALMDRLQARVAAGFVPAAALFLAVYIVATSLSLPVAIWLTLAGGALFGLFWGTILSSFGASIGATGAFLLSRHLLRDSVQSRYGDRLELVNGAIARDGAFYLFTLRLVPAFPFFLVNLLMGLSTMPVRIFYLVSQLGMLPAAIVYTNAGTRLAGMTRIDDVVSPEVLMAFAALGVLPWFGKGLIGLLRRRRLHSRWTRPARFDRNLVVIGAGAAGLVSAYVAAAVRAKVTLIEAGAMGGDCLNTGCVPSKTLIRSASAAHAMRNASRLGLADCDPPIRFRAIMERVHDVIDSIAPHDSVERYTALGVDVVKGRARLVDPWTVEVTLADGSQQRLTSRAVVLATGAEPVMPPVPGLREAAPLTSETLWEQLSQMDAPPPRLGIMGGGAMGCELAQAFARLGSSVTIIEASPGILPQEDREASQLVHDSLSAEGVTILTGCPVERAGTIPGGKWIEITRDGMPVRHEFDEILLAAGRRARTQGFGLEELGIPAGQTIETNGWLQTLYPNIYAAGDAAGPFHQTHAGSHQGVIATTNALFGIFRKFRPDYRTIPFSVFTDPEIARVGLTVAEAARQSIPVEVTRFDTDELDRALVDGCSRGFVKVLTPPGRDRILGVTIVGAHASERLAEFTLAMKQRLGLTRILSTVHAYPTLAEANRLAAGEWRRSHLNPRLLRLLERFHEFRRR